MKKMFCPSCGKELIALEEYLNIGFGKFEYDYKTSVFGCTDCNIEITIDEYEHKGE